MWFKFYSVTLSSSPIPGPFSESKLWVCLKTDLLIQKVKLGVVPLLYLKEQMLTSGEKHHSHSLLPASIPRPNGEEEESLEHGVGR